MQRIFRVKDAAEYCGCGETIFNEKIKPYVKKHYWLFDAGHYDREDLDAFIAEKNKEVQTMACDKQPVVEKGTRKWQQRNSQASQSEVKRGTSTSNTAVVQFDKAVLQVTGKKPKAF